MEKPIVKKSKDNNSFINLVNHYEPSEKVLEKYQTLVDFRAKKNEMIKIHEQNIRHPHRMSHNSDMYNPY